MKIRPFLSFLMTCGTLLLLDDMTPLYAQPDTGGPQSGNQATTGVLLDGGGLVAATGRCGPGPETPGQRRRSAPPPHR